MTPISEAFADRLRKPHTRASRVTVEDAGGLVLQEITGGSGTVLDGSLAISEGDRKLSLQISNPKGINTPEDAESLFWWTNRIRVERGIVVSGSPDLLPRGRYLIEEYEVERTKGGSLLTLSCSGMLSRGRGSRFTTATTYSEGDRVGDVVSGILTDAGLGLERGPWDDGGQELGASRTFDVGVDRIPAAARIALDFALDLDEDEEGLPTLEPTPDPYLDDPVWVFEPGETSTLLGVKKRVTRDQIKNHSLVGGETPWRDPIWSERRNLDPSSPAYNPPPPDSGPLGDLLIQYQSSMIYTQAQADAVAEDLLRTHGLIQEILTIPIVANPALQVGDVVGVVEEESRVNDRYVVDQITVPLRKGPMILMARKVRSLTEVSEPGIEAP